MMTNEYSNDQQSREMAAVFYGEGAITNLEYHKDGQYLVMTTSESSIHLIDSINGVEKKKLYAKDGGIGKIQYTHHDSCVLFSTEYKRNGNEIKYLSMYDNRYIRYFKSSSEKITSISMSPIDDHFLCSTAHSVNLWDLSSPNVCATLQLPPNCEETYVSYDGSGVIFGVMSMDSRYKTHNLRLYDARNYDKGPFEDLAPTNQTLDTLYTRLMPHQAPMQIQRMVQSPWTGLEFSGDGLHILVNTNTDAVLVLDGFKRDVDPKVIIRKNEEGTNLGACFTTDAQQVITGNDDNDILFFNKETGFLNNTLKGHVSPVGCIRCNPKYDVIASSCVNTVLWLPTK